MEILHLPARSSGSPLYHVTRDERNGDSRRDIADVNAADVEIDRQRMVQSFEVRRRRRRRRW